MTQKNLDFFEKKGLHVFEFSYYMYFVRHESLYFKPVSLLGKSKTSRTVRDCKPGGSS